MKINFISELLHPEMNHFLWRLQYALENLPNNPKPSCEGFYLAYYNPWKSTLVTEKFGYVPQDKDFKYMHFAGKKVTQTLLFGAKRSKDFENNDLEQYPGAITMNGLDSDLIFCAGVSGHDSMVDEAISALWLVAKQFMAENFRSGMLISHSNDKFFFYLKERAEEMQKRVAPDNSWIVPIAEIMMHVKGKIGGAH